MQSLHRAILCFCLVLGAGCEPEVERPPAHQSAPSFGGARNYLGAHEAPPSGDYPPGPYAFNNPQEGEVVENLEFQGFLPASPGDRAADGEFSWLTMQDLRASGARYLLVHVSSFWCATCLVGADRLNQYIDEIHRAGGATLELLVDGQATGADPRKVELEVWADSADLKMPTVGPGEDRVRAVFPDREFVYIVELATMEVVSRIQGLNEDPMPIEIAAEELLGVWLQR